MKWKCVMIEGNNPKNPMYLSIYRLIDWDRSFDINRDSCTHEPKNDQKISKLNSNKIVQQFRAGRRRRKKILVLSFVFIQPKCRRKINEKYPDNDPDYLLLVIIYTHHHHHHHLVQQQQQRQQRLFSLPIIYFLFSSHQIVIDWMNRIMSGGCMDNDDYDHLLYSSLPSLIRFFE